MLYNTDHTTDYFPLKGVRQNSKGTTTIVDCFGNGYYWVNDQKIMNLTYALLKTITSFDHKPVYTSHYSNNSRITVDSSINHIDSFSNKDYVLWILLASLWNLPASNSNRPASNWNLPASNWNRLASNCNLPASNCNLPASNWNRPYFNWNCIASNCNRATSNYNCPSSNWNRTASNWKRHYSNWKRPYFKWNRHYSNWNHPYALNLTCNEHISNTLHYTFLQII